MVQTKGLGGRVVSLQGGAYDEEHDRSFYRYARNRDNQTVASQEAETSPTNVTGTWAATTMLSASDSIGTATANAEVKWTISFSKAGYYLVKARCEYGASNSWYIKNNTRYEPYVELVEDRLRRANTLTWSWHYALIYCDAGSNDIQVKKTEAANRSIESLKFYPVDPIAIVSDSNEDECNFELRNRDA